MGGDIHTNPPALGVGADNTVLVGRDHRHAMDIMQALLGEHGCHQCRAEVGADGVGALDTQVGSNGQVGHRA